MSRESGVLEPQAGSGAFTPCGVPGCTQPTREGKPHCIDHLARMPYVREIERAVAEREDEHARVRVLGAQAVDLSGLTARELLLHLDLNGPATVERLARSLSLDNLLARAYVEALARRGWVTLGRTARGSTAVRPVRPSARQRAIAAPLDPGVDAVAS